MSRYLRPARDADKEFSYLYPAELLALAAGRNAAGEVVVPIERRLLYVLGAYAGSARNRCSRSRGKTSTPRTACS